MSAQSRVNSLGPSAKTKCSVRMTEDGAGSRFRLALVPSSWKLVQVVILFVAHRLSVTSASAERRDRERLSEFVEGGRYSRGNMLVLAHIAEGDDVLAWLAGALGRCAPVLECAGGVQATWAAARRTKDSEINACVSCTRLMRHCSEGRESVVG